MRLPLPLPVLFRAIYGAVLLAPLALSSATISTPSLGEIYTMPSWMPTSVSAANTPGSLNSSKPTRITAATYAAYAAAQEAILERIYYLYSQTSDYAPNEVEYCYDAGRWPPTSLITNLVMSSSTRILPGDARKWAPVTFDSSRGFYKPLFNYYFFFFRHGELASSRPSVRLATSLWGGYRHAFPEFDWTSNPVSAIGNWRNIGINFANLKPDFILPYGVDQPLGYFGEYARSIFPSSAAFTNNTVVTPRKTLTSVLSNSFAAVDYRWLTNDTERIVWNRLAAADELLAAIDRAYWYHAGWLYLGYIMTDMTAHRTDVATVDASRTYLSSGDVYGTITYQSSWTTTTNYVAVTNQSWGTSSTVLTDVDSFSPGVSGMPGSAGVGSIFLQVGDLAAHFSGHSFRTVPIEVYDITTAISGDHFTVDMTLHSPAGDTWQISKPFSYIPPTTPITVGLWATASSRLIHTVAPDALNMTDVPIWPSWRAFNTGRIKDYEIASVSHFTADQTNAWRCAHANPASLSAARTFAADDIAAQIDYCIDYITSKTGANPLTAAYVTDPADNAITAAEFPNPTFAKSIRTVIKPGLTFDDHPTDDYSTLPQAVIEDGKVVDIINPVIGSFELVLTPEPNYYVPGRPACSAECRSIQLYRADFNWHTLRLSP